jgi:hypothetical protein
MEYATAFFYQATTPLTIIQANQGVSAFSIGSGKEMMIPPITSPNLKSRLLLRICPL